MSQNALALSTTGPLPGLTGITGINNAFDSLSRWLSGPSAPSASGLGLSNLAGVVWHDTANNVLKVRDQADSAWISIGNIDEVNKLFSPAGTGLRYPTSGGVGLSASATLSYANAGGWIAVQNSGITLTLPPLGVSTTGSLFTFVMGAGNSSTIKGSGSDNIVGINGATSNAISIQQGQQLRIVSNGGQWWVLDDALSAATLAATLAAIYAPLMRLGSFLDSVQYNVSTTLTAADVGKLVVQGGSSGPTFTLPSTAAVFRGGKITMVAESGLTLAAVSGDVIYHPELGSNLSSLAVPPGSLIELTQYYVGSWFITGGNPISGNAGLGGSGQTWTDVSASRAIGATYTNSTGRPIEVSVAYELTSGNALQLNCNGSPLSVISGNNAPIVLCQTMTAVIPNGGTYSVTYYAGSSSITMFWKELR